MESYNGDRLSFEIKDGILFCTFHNDFLDYYIVDEGIKKRVEFIKDRSFPMLSDLRKVKGISKEARERLSDDDGLIGIPALAIVYKTRFQLFVISVYELIYKPKIPTKYFRDMDKAHAWLQQYK